MSEESVWIRRVMAGAEPASTPELRARLAQLDGDLVATLVHAHQIGPWLLAALRATDGSLPEPAIALKQIAFAQAGLALAHQSELARILQALHNAGVEVLVLKGPALARTLYPQPGLRPYRDLDLLVREPALAVAARILEEWGYEAKIEGSEGPRLHHEHGQFQQIYLDKERQLRVELHGDHLQIGVQPAHMDQIWERAETIALGGVEARALERHDLFVHLCVHLHRHGFSRLIWFKDLDLILRRDALDWGIVERRAQDQGCLDSVARSLELVETLLGTPLPAPARRLIARRPLWSRWLQRLVWPTGPLVALKPQRQWRFRRLVQFAPETGLLQGGLPSLLFTGRRSAKLRVLASALPGMQGRNRGRARAARDETPRDPESS
ncbi:MAG: nucleotidyltransferase family protein [Chloroflexi bacterium]|nr:nucleotidyltransferase family protein [Chloroflexota bacterium]